MQELAASDVEDVYAGLTSGDQERPGEDETAGSRQPGPRPQSVDQFVLYEADNVDVSVSAASSQQASLYIKGEEPSALRGEDLPGDPAHHQVEDEEAALPGQ